LFAWFGYKFDNRYLFVCLAFVFLTYINIFNELVLTFSRVNKQFSRYNLICLTFGALQVGLVILSVSVLQLGLTGLIGTLLVTELLQGIYSFIVSRRIRKLIHNINKAENKNKLESIRTLLKGSTIFIPSIFSSWLLMNIDQWMLGSMMGLGSVGLYGLAYKFSLLFDFLFASSVLMVYRPHIYEQFKSKFHTTSILNLKVALICLFGSILIYFISDQMTFILKYIINESYYPSLTYIPPLLLAACIRLSTQILILTLIYKECIQHIIATNIIAAVFNATLNFFLIPLYGIQGCILATVSSFALIFVITLFKKLQLMRNEQETGDNGLTPPL